MDFIEKMQDKKGYPGSWEEGKEKCSEKNRTDHCWLAFFSSSTKVEIEGGKRAEKAE